MKFHNFVVREEHKTENSETEKKKTVLSSFVKQNITLPQAGEGGRGDGSNMCTILIYLNN